MYERKSKNWKLETKDELLTLKFLSSIRKQRNDRRPQLMADAITPLLFYDRWPLRLRSREQ